MYSFQIHDEGALKVEGLTEASYSETRPNQNIELHIFRPSDLYGVLCKGAGDCLAEWVQLLRASRTHMHNTTQYSI